MALLRACGYTYIPPAEANALRGARLETVLLESTFCNWADRHNRVTQHGEPPRPFSEANTKEAIRRLRNFGTGPSGDANQDLYNTLTLGVSLEEPAPKAGRGGGRRSHTFQYIDWENVGNNDFHVTTEFTVRRRGANQSVRPDIVLFVNGIPLCVIECKSPDVGAPQGVSQMIRNQRGEYIPHLFVYAQLLVAAAMSDARYAVTGTGREFWSSWEESEDTSDDLKAIVRQAGEIAGRAGERSVTRQDRTLYGLCRPARLLGLVRDFILYEKGQKKIARYQQFFVVRSALKRLRAHKAGDGAGATRAREGGIIWHTQGSGKSLTMVMLARKLARNSGIPNPRIVLVTDRVDLNTQLADTFAACNMTIKRAKTGRQLIGLLREKADLITTLIHKFDTALDVEEFIDTSGDIIMLVDESHRTNFGLLAGQMRTMLPNAAYIGFTGTPLLKSERNNFEIFGPLIRPSYPIRQAVADKAVVPLRYEGRRIAIKQNREEMDTWFERYTRNLTTAAQDMLKRKFTSIKAINTSDPVIRARSLDISEHYRTTWQGGGFKGQLVAPSKAAAIAYRDCLRDIGEVSAEVVISPPDTREDHVEVDGDLEKVQAFWAEMMERYGDEEKYTQSIIRDFKEADTPEILIVVDKLLTGFDAPRNIVLYLCKKLREHTLLQAVARVNRLHPGKEYGYVIDYEYTLEDLTSALTHYKALAEYDDEDIADTLEPVNGLARTLPEKHAALRDMFGSVKNKNDLESYQQYLRDEQIRDRFKECLTEFRKVFAIALSTESFIRETSIEMLREYRKDLRWFAKLRDSVNRRYAGLEERYEIRKHEEKIQEILNTYIQAEPAGPSGREEGTGAGEASGGDTPVSPIDPLDEITGKKNVTREMPTPGGYKEDGRTEADRADEIAYTTLREVTTRMEEDPVLYKKFSELIQAAIDEFQRAPDFDAAVDYLNRIQEIRGQVTSPQETDPLPEEISADRETSAYYRKCRELLSDNTPAKEALRDIALAVKGAVRREYKVDYWHDAQAVNNTRQHIDDYLCDTLPDKHAVTLPGKLVDSIIEETLRIARHHTSEAE